MRTSNHFGKSSAMLTLASLTLIVAVLYLVKGILAPIMLALLLSFLLAPICDWLERRRLGRIPSVFLTATLTFVAIGSGVWTTTNQIIDLAPKIPEYQSNIQTKLRAVNGYLGDAIDRLRKSAEEMSHNLPEATPGSASETLVAQAAPVRVISTPANPMQVFGEVFGSALAVVGSTGVVIILVVFMLLRREDLRDRFIRLIGRSQLTVTTQVMEDASKRVSRFLLMQLLTNVIFGVLIGVGLYFIGVPHASLWGILATLLRFIPYFGAWIAAAAPIGLSMAISTTWVAPMMTAGLFLILELFVSNFVEPWIYGRNTGVSSMAILVSAVFWTWIWGPLGLLLAIPLTVCFLVIGKHVPQLSFLDILLGNEPVLDSRTRVYQRLLAGDQEEAADLLLDELDHRPLVEIYDTVLIPSLALAEIHRRRGDLDDDRHKFIFQGLREMIEHLSERGQALKMKEVADAKVTADDESEPANVRSETRPIILCLAAHDEADEIVGRMLAQLLESSGYRVQVVPAADLFSDLVGHFEQQSAKLVCISSTPPAAVMRARFLCRRIRSRFPRMDMVVGLWNAKGDLNKATERVAGGDAVQVVVSLADACAAIHQAVPLPAPRPKVMLNPDVNPLVADAAPV